MSLKNWSLILPDRRKSTLSPGYDVLTTTTIITGEAAAHGSGCGTPEGEPVKRCLGRRESKSSDKQCSSEKFGLGAWSLADQRPASGGQSISTAKALEDTLALRRDK